MVVVKLCLLLFVSCYSLSIGLCLFVYACVYNPDTTLDVQPVVGQFFLVLSASSHFSLFSLLLLLLLSLLCVFPVPLCSFFWCVFFVLFRALPSSLSLTLDTKEAGLALFILWQVLAKLADSIQCSRCRLRRSKRTSRCAASARSIADRCLADFGTDGFSCLHRVNLLSPADARSPTRR